MASMTVSQHFGSMDFLWFRITLRFAQLGNFLSLYIYFLGYWRWESSSLESIASLKVSKFVIEQTKSTVIEEVLNLCAQFPTTTAC
jgi:hypothetical protein